MEELPLVSSPRPLIPGTNIGLRTATVALGPRDRIAVVARPPGADPARLPRVATVARVEAARPGPEDTTYVDAYGEALVHLGERRAGRVRVSPVDAGRPRVSPDLVERVEAALRRYLAVGVESGEAGDIDIGLSGDPVAASHEVASQLRISWPEVQELLEAGSAGDRLGRALLVLQRETGLLRSILGGKGTT